MHFSNQSSTDRWSFHTNWFESQPVSVFRPFTRSLFKLKPIALEGRGSSRLICFGAPIFLNLAGEFALRGSSPIAETRLLRSRNFLAGACQRWSLEPCSTHGLIRDWFRLCDCDQLSRFKLGGIAKPTTGRLQTWQPTIRALTLAGALKVCFYCPYKGQANRLASEAQIWETVLAFLDSWAKMFPVGTFALWQQ